MALDDGTNTHIHNHVFRLYFSALTSYCIVTVHGLDEEAWHWMMAHAHTHTYT
jgi:hypothetical protein